MTIDITQKRPLGRSGLDVTLASLGGAGLGNLYKPVPRAQAQGTLAAAWEAGVRFFDTAPRYGHGLSERRFGDFLRDHPRDSYVLSTKVGRLLTPLKGRTMGYYGFAEPLPFEQEYDYSYDGVMRSHEDSLQRLGLDRIDVLLIHDIGRDTHGDANDEYFPIAMDGGVKALQELKRAGDIAAFGLGVNEVEVCLDAMEHADFDCFLLAGRYTLLEQTGAAELLEKCVARGTSIIAGGVFNSGILATGAVPGAKFNYEEAPPAIVAKVQAIEAVCKRHGVPMIAAAQQFALHHEAVASILLGVADASRVESNIAAFNVPIPDALWSELAEL